MRSFHTIPLVVVSVFFVASIFVFGFLVSGLWDFTVDDAYICMRYSKNVASGEGFVWNPGEEPSEGCVNFLWMSFNVIPFEYSMNPFVFTKIIGIIFAVLVLGCFFLIARLTFNNLKSALVAAILSGAIFLSNPASAIHGLSGLETMGYAFFVLVMLASAYGSVVRKSRAFLISLGLSGLVASLLRPEAILTSLVLLLFVFYRLGFSSSNFRKEFVIYSVILWLLPLIAFFGFKYSYFGDLLPLPFYVKTASIGIEGISWGIKSSLIALHYVVGALLLIIFGIQILYSSNNKISFSENTRGRVSTLLIISVLILVFGNVSYVKSYLDMNYAQRFFFPSFTIIYSLVGIFFVFLVAFQEKSLGGKWNKPVKLIFMVVVVFLLTVSNIAFFFGFQNYRYLQEYSKGLNTAHVKIGRFLGDSSVDNFTIASSDAGAIGYYSELNHVDIYGLTDEFIGKNGGATLEYLIIKNPKLIIFNSVGGTREGVSGEKQLVFLEYIESEGDFIEIAPIKHSDYYLLPFLKNESQYLDVREGLEEISVRSLAVYPDSHGT